MGDAAAPTLGEAVAGYLSQQHAVLQRADADLRRDLDGVHRTRVASRRFRSILRVFADVFDDDAAHALDAELAWYAALLGGARDAEVLRRHLADTLHAIGAPHVTARVTACVDEYLCREQDAAAAQLRRELDGERYRALSAELTAWQSEPRFTSAAAGPPETVTGYVDSAQHTLDRRLRRALRPGADDDTLHRTRKAAKRTRYAAELAVPVVGTAARRVVKQATGLQQVLGEHHDTVLARAVLERLSAADTASSFAYGIAYERERERAEDARRSLRKAVRHG